MQCQPAYDTDIPVATADKAHANNLADGHANNAACFTIKAQTVCTLIEYLPGFHTNGLRCWVAGY